MRRVSSSSTKAFSWMESQMLRFGALISVYILLLSCRKCTRSSGLRVMRKIDLAVHLLKLMRRASHQFLSNFYLLPFAELYSCHIYFCTVYGILHCVLLMFVGRHHLHPNV